MKRTPTTLSAPALGLTAGILWGCALLIIGAVGSAAPPYGRAVLDLVASVYPGFHNTGTPTDLAIGTAYAFGDGLVGGLMFGWLYNLLLRLFTFRRGAE